MEDKTQSTKSSRGPPRTNRIKRGAVNGEDVNNARDAAGSIIAGLDG